jgi:hypothetical protein
VLEAAFVLLEFSSPSRRIFIGSHSLSPSLVRRIGPSQWTDEIEEMLKESEDKYTRIHGMEKRRWLRAEILHQRGQG